jgi:hypothetical protein
MSLDSEFEDTIKIGLEKIKRQFGLNFTRPENYETLSKGVLALSEAYKNIKEE